MAKNKTEQQSVHIVLQEKGGIGKSFVANMLLQYLKSKGSEVIGIDTDPSNASLAAYKSLDVQQLEIMDGKRINIKRFDDLMNLIHTTENDYVIDIGSSNFIGYNEYISTQGIYSIIESMGVKVFLHIIVVGAEARDQTLLGLKKIVAQDVPDKSVVIWENEHFGKLDETKSILNTPFIKGLADKIFGGIVLEKSNNDLHGNDILRMQKKHYTFDDAKASDSFDFMEIMRLEGYRTALWDKFDLIFTQGEGVPECVTESSVE